MEARLACHRTEGKGGSLIVLRRGFAAEAASLPRCIFKYAYLHDKQQLRVACTAGREGFDSEENASCCGCSCGNRCATKRAKIIFHAEILEEQRKLFKGRARDKQESVGSAAFLSTLPVPW